MRLKALDEFKDLSSFDFFPLVFLFSAVLPKWSCISTVLQLGLSTFAFGSLWGGFSLATQAINSGEFSRVLGKPSCGGPLLVSPISMFWEPLKCMLLEFLDGRSGPLSSGLELGSSRAPQACKFERRLLLLARFPDHLPSGRCLDLIESGSLTLRLSLCYCAGCIRTWKLTLNKASLHTAYLSRHIQRSQKLSIQGCYENQMCFIYESLCSLPASQRKKVQAANANNFSNRSFYENACFLLSFLKTRESHKWQFQKP